MNNIIKEHAKHAGNSNIYTVEPSCTSDTSFYNKKSVVGFGVLSGAPTMFVNKEEETPVNCNELSAFLAEFGHREKITVCDIAYDFLSTSEAKFKGVLEYNDSIHLIIELIKDAPEDNEDDKDEYELTEPEEKR